MRNLPNGKLRKSKFRTWFSAASRSISASEMIERHLAFSCSGSNASTETSVTFLNRYQDASMPHQMAGVRAENSGVREVSLSFDVSGNDQQNPASPAGLRLG